MESDYSDDDSFDYPKFSILSNGFLGRDFPRPFPSRPNAPIPPINLPSPRSIDSSPKHHNN